MELCTPFNNNILENVNMNLNRDLARKRFDKPIHEQKHSLDNIHKTHTLNINSDFN